MQAHVTAAPFAFSRTKGAFQFKNWKIQLEKYLWCDLSFRSTNKVLPLLAATSTFLHNSQNWGTSLTSRATKPVKESQTQLRQLKSSLSPPFLHVRARCLVVQWNLIQDVLRLPHWFGMTVRGLLCFDPVLLPLSLPIFTLLLYLKSARNIRKRKNSNETSSPQSWEVRNKRVVKINENKFSKKYFKVFFITESSASC